MKVLQIINSLDVGGAERLIAEIVPLMKSKKMDIDVLILKNTDTPFKKTLQEKGVNVFYVKNTSLYSPFQIFKIKPYPLAELIH